MAPADFRPGRSIALVGLMGAGKSTVGAALASRLGLPFADSDREIERRAKHSVARLFERDGEAAFRDRERLAVAALDGAPSRVLAVGGGAFVDEETRRFMLERWTIVWLDAPARTLAGRLAGDRERPLLRGRDAEAVLAELAERRRPFYAQASIRVDAEPAVEVVVEQILARLAALD